MCSILEEGQYVVKSGRRKSLDRAGEEHDEQWSVVDKTPLFDFVWPMGGMFLWVHMQFETHPLWNKIDKEKLAMALWILLTTSKYLVLVSPGSIFASSENIRKEKSWAYFRMCFAAVDEPDVEKCSRRFVEGVKSFWGINRVADIEKLLEGDGVAEMEDLVDLRGVC